MKKKIVLLMILIIGFTAGNALANALTNHGFEVGDLGRFGGPPIPAGRLTAQTVNITVMLMR